MYSCAYVEKSEHNLMETVLSFHHVGSRDQTQGINLTQPARVLSTGPFHQPSIHLYLCGTLEKVQIVNFVLLRLENGWKTAKKLIELE